MRTARTEASLDVADRLSDSDMARLAKLVYEVAGIVLDDSRRALVVGRLAKRVRALGLSSYRDYVRIVTEDASKGELQNLINAITTNKTSFFREPHHFVHLRERILERMQAARTRPELRRLHIWSAGCSTGEEPYTIAMTVAQALGAELGDWDVAIVATDIDSDVLATAKRGVYSRERSSGLPANTAQYFDNVKLPDGNPGRAIRPELKDLIRFEQLNFMASSWPVNGSFDHIFCRNVTIYFDRPTQATLYPRLVSQLASDGHFYAGHSENLTWLPELLRPIGLTIYTHASAHVASPTARGVKRPPTESGVVLAAPRVRPNLPEKSVHAGDVVATSDATVLKTALGSCISVCMFDPIAKIGGMNHFMLPSSKEENETSNRFGIQAMETLINKLLHLGAARHRLVAKVAGACSVIDVTIDGRSVADRNLEFVDEFLRVEGFTVTGRKVGGTRALEVRFRTDTGEAMVRAVDASASTRIARDDEEYARRVVKPAVVNDEDGVTWFR